MAQFDDEANMLCVVQEAGVVAVSTVDVRTCSSITVYILSWATAVVSYKTRLVTPPKARARGNRSVFPPLCY
jgi:hypothetical protein